jgi:hypothetical protein
MILNNYYEEPYNKFAPEGPLPILSKTIVKSKLSPKFWKSTQKIYDEITRTNNVKQQYNNEKEYVDEQVQVQDYNTPQQQYNFNEHEMVEVSSKGKRPLSGGKLRAKPNQYNTNEQEYLAQQAPMENDIERLKNTDFSKLEYKDLKHERNLFNEYGYIRLKSVEENFYTRELYKAIRGE